MLVSALMACDLQLRVGLKAPADGRAVAAHGVAKVTPLTVEAAQTGWSGWSQYFTDFVIKNLTTGRCHSRNLAHHTVLPGFQGVAIAVNNGVQRPSE